MLGQEPARARARAKHGQKVWKFKNKLASVVLVDFVIKNEFKNQLAAMVLVDL